MQRSPCSTSLPTAATSTTAAARCIPTYVAAEVSARGADLGLTFDGDADRCMLAGAHNNVDQRRRHSADGRPRSESARHAHRRSGRRHHHVQHGPGSRAQAPRHPHAARPVGDRYVLEQMLEHNAALGGEQSGHILFPHLATTGDGLLTALVVLDLIARTGKTIDELTADLKVFPQVIVNVKVREKKPLESIPAVAAAIRAAEEELKDSGRVVIRYSGTEALARVMIEAESEDAMRRHADAIADAIRAEARRVGTLRLAESLAAPALASMFAASAGVVGDCLSAAQARRRNGSPKKAHRRLPAVTQGPLPRCFLQGAQRTTCPGIGRMTGERLRSQARATCSGVAFSCDAAFSSASCARLA